MNMAGTDIRSACMSIPEDWQRLAFDALMLPVFDLKLTDRETGAYAAGAAKAAQRITWTPYDAARKGFLEEVTFNRILKGESIWVLSGAWLSWGQSS